MIETITFCLLIAGITFIIARACRSPIADNRRIIRRCFLEKLKRANLNLPYRRTAKREIKKCKFDDGWHKVRDRFSSYVVQTDLWNILCWQVIRDIPDFALVAREMEQDKKLSLHTINLITKLELYFEHHDRHLWGWLRANLESETIRRYHADLLLMEGGRPHGSTPVRSAA